MMPYINLKPWSAIPNPLVIPTFSSQMTPKGAISTPDFQNLEIERGSFSNRPLYTILSYFFTLKYDQKALFKHHIFKNLLALQRGHPSQTHPYPIPLVTLSRSIILYFGSKYGSLVGRKFQAIFFGKQKGNIFFATMTHAMIVVLAERRLEIT